MTNSSKSHLPSLFSALLFIVAALLFMGISLLMGLTAVGTFLAGRPVGAQETILFVVGAFQALILLAAAFVAGMRFANRPFAEQDSAFHIPVWLAAGSALVAAIALWIGHQLVRSETANWLLLPVLTLPAVVLPLFAVLGLGVRKLALGTRWQSWNVFGLAMTLSPFILIFLEVVVLLLLLIVVVGVLMTQPGLEAEIERLARLMNQLDPQSEAAQRLIAPYIVRPGVMAFALLYFALIVPLLEEVFKPLGVWFFAGKLTSPAHGFALGALSGAAYGLIETFGVSAQTADWAGLLLTRIGTGTLHITTSALMGAGIVYAVRERRYLRFLGLYVFSVFLHGLWNALAILVAFSTMAELFAVETPLSGFVTPINVGLAVLAVFLLVILLVSNRRMRAALPQPIEDQLPPQQGQLSS